MIKIACITIFFTISLNLWSQCPTAGFSTNDTISCSYPFELIVTDMSTNSDTWTWDFGDGSPTSILQNPTHSYPNEGSYTVELTALNSVSGCDDIHTIQIIIDSVDINLVVNVNMMCFNWTYNTSPNFSFTDVSNEGTNWLWDFGDNSTLSTAAGNTSHAYTDTGYYDVSLIKTNASGCSATDTLSSGVYIVPTPIGGFYLSPISNLCSIPDTLILQDTSYTFGLTPNFNTGVSLNGGSFYIPFSNTLSADTIILPAYGTWQFVRTISTMGGYCYDTTFYTIDILPGYEQFDTVDICYNSSYLFNNNVLIDSIVVDTSFLTTYTSQNCDSLVHTYLSVTPEINTNASVNICYNSSYVFNNNVLIDSIATDTTFLTTYIGQYCDSLVYTSLIVTPEINTNDTIPICYNSSYTFNNNILISSIVTDTSFIAMHVGQNCDSIVHTYLSVNPEINTNVTQNGIELSANNGDANYQWVDCNNSFMEINGETSQTYISQTNGEYAVVVNEFGCSDTSNCYNIEEVGLVEKYSNLEFKLYPNPSSGIFYLKDNIEASFIIEIIDLSGRVLYSKRSSLNSSHIKLDLQLKKGVYFVKATTLNGQSSTKRITIQ